MILERMTTSLKLFNESYPEPSRLKIFLLQIQAHNDSVILTVTFDFKTRFFEGR